MLRAYVALTALAIVAVAVFSPDGELAGHPAERMDVADRKEQAPPDGAQYEVIQLLYVLAPKLAQKPVRM